MIRVVINASFGGFKLSAAAMLHLIQIESTAIKTTPLADYSYAIVDDFIDGYTTHISGPYHSDSVSGSIIDTDLHLVYDLYDGADTPPAAKCSYIDCTMYVRTHPDVINVVSQMGERSFGHGAKLHILEITDDVSVDNLTISEYAGKEWVAERHKTWQ